MSAHQDDRDGLGRTNGSPAEAAQAGRDFVAARSLKRQLLAELRASWEAAKPIPPEELLGRWPANTEADPDVASLLSEDYWQHRQQGQQLTCEEYQQRFPDQKDSLVSLLQQQALVQSCGGAVVGGSRILALPAVGDELFGFRLCQELGRGSYARVFLAQQKELAARPVVVKVSAIDGDEPRRLAQLQHTHIVPIYSVHEDVQAGLRVVCMPYFGSANLSHVLQALWAKTDRPTQGKELVAALLAVRGPWSPDDEAAQTIDRETLAFLDRLSYVNAAAWIIACLAEALQHAHQRGVLHRDIKPSNILLSADGQPMLLDFNLAENLHEEHAQAVASVGGTVAYMAPEHLHALALRDPALVRKVDHRADLYGLGMVFYEILTGRRPFEQSGSYSPMPSLIEAMAVERAGFAPSLRRHRPDVPWSLESIIRKCLEPDPAHRYQQADHLKEDLRRYLEDRPLRYAPERSWRERISKWRRRHPRLATNGMIAAAAVLLLTIGSAMLFSALKRASEGERAIAQQTKQLFLTDAAQARCFLNATIGEHAPLEQGLDVCERALCHYGVLQRDDWQEQAIWQWLAVKEQQQVSEDMRELLLLLARARIRRVQPSALFATIATVGPAASPANGLASAVAGQEFQDTATAALEDGLFLLNRAYALGDAETARAIWEDRAVYLESLGRSDEAKRAEKLAKANPLTTARDHYLRGASYADNGRYPAAIEELEKALDLKPAEYWPHFLLGICFRNQHRYDLAAMEFRACTVLWPKFSWGYFNLGEALHRHGERFEALRAYANAIGCEPKIAQAYYNRGLIYLDLGEWKKALDDFAEVPPGACSDEVLYASRGIALTWLRWDDEANAAFAKAWANGWQNLDLRLNYAFLISKRQPEDTWKIFQEILKRDPRNAHAMYGCGMLLEYQRRDSEEAVFWFSQALQLKPNFVEARLARAIVFAHQGRGETAREQIDLCVSQDPKGQTLYQAACFYALLAAKSEKPLAASWAESALQLLEEAFKQGYGRDKAVEDSDLDGIRHYPEFRRLLQQPGVRSQESGVRIERSGCLTPDS
jgi:serine/threonine protein kinase/tetratricopeptide (TPR) repeat protein